jgi:hypothetical protein
MDIILFKFIDEGSISSQEPAFLAFGQALTVRNDGSGNEIAHFPAVYNILLYLEAVKL